MDEVMKDIQDEIPCCMLFADDVVLINESKIGVDKQLKFWRQTLKSKDSRLSRTKTEYTKCEFSGVRSDDENVTLFGQVVPTKDPFRY